MLRAFQHGHMIKVWYDELINSVSRSHVESILHYAAGFDVENELGNVYERLVISY